MKDSITRRDFIDGVACAIAASPALASASVQSAGNTAYPPGLTGMRGSRDQDFVNKAYMFDHYSRELTDLIDQGALHDHSQARAQLKKDLHYRRYMLDHHQHQHSH